jgi:hypothetical protein
MSPVFVIFFNLFMIFVFLPLCLYPFCRVFIPVLGAKDAFFSTPKLGRVKARGRGGKIVGFFDNIIGKNKHVNKLTGKIEDGEVLPNNFWWNNFGAHYIGLDEIYRYQIATEAIENENYELKYEIKDASSIFIEGSYPLTAYFVTKDGVRLKIKLQLKLTTLDVAKALSLPLSWTIPVFATVLASSRDFFGSRTTKMLIATPNEGRNGNTDSHEFRNSDYINQILSLNEPKIGNVSLEQLCGQRIDAVNIIDIDFVDKETREAFYAPFVAEQKAEKQVMEALAYARTVKIKSEADSLAAENIALAKTKIGTAEADVYAKKHVGLGNDSKATAQVVTAEKQSEMQNITTLVNGGASPQVTIPVTGKRG